MRRRALFLAVFLAVAACSTFTSTSDGPSASDAADAADAGDAAVEEAAAPTDARADRQSFCLTTDAAFCDDFEGPLGAKWTSFESYGDAAVLTRAGNPTDYYLRANLFADSGAAYFNYVLPVVARPARISFSFTATVSIVDSDHYVEIATIVGTNGGNLGIGYSTGSIILFTPADATDIAPPGGGSRTRYRVVVDGASVTAYIDDAVTPAGTLTMAPDAGLIDDGGTRFAVGVYYAASAASGGVVDIDDVVLDWQ